MPATEPNRKESFPFPTRSQNVATKRTQWGEPRPAKPKRYVQWTSLSPLSIEDFYDAGLKKRIEQCNKKIKQLLEARKAIDDHVQNLRDQNPEKMAPDAFTTPLVKVEIISLLQSELPIRDQINELCRAAVQQQQTAAREAQRSLNETRDKVRGQLAKIGYHDVPVTQINPHKIQPGWIAAHPDVCSAEGHLAHVRSLARWLFELARENEATAKGVREKLTQHRDEACRV